MEQPRLISDLAEDVDAASKVDVSSARSMTTARARAAANIRVDTLVLELLSMKGGQTQ